MMVKMAALFFTIVIILFILYGRYFPVRGITCNYIKDLDVDKINVIDVRDYNESYKNPIGMALNIPIGYLKRNYREIPNGDIHLVVSSLIERNIGVRFLRNKGFRVIGYTILNDNQFNLKDDSLKVETNG
jgi:rhodanese-related sulfurtransferase